MKKRIAPVLLLVFVLLAAIGVLAACNESETRSDAAPDPTPVDYFTFEPNSTRDGYVLTGTQKILPSDVVIPSEYMGLPVTTIGESAFEGCTEIESVQYDGTSVVTISPSAYKNCQSLQETVLPSSLQTIGYSAFEQCSSLEKVVLPDSLQSLGASAFKNCHHLQTVNIETCNITAIYDSVFEGCSSMESVLLPASITEIYERAFAYCSSLKHIGWNENLSIIHPGAFMYCLSLTEVVLPASVDFVFNLPFKDFELGENYALIRASETYPLPKEDCIDFLLGKAKLESDPYFPYKYFEEVPGSFEGCSSLSKLSFDEHTYITPGAFRGCTALKTVICV